MSASASGTLTTFVPIPDTAVVMDLLMARLPKSANVYNQALFHSKFPKDMKFYYLDPIRRNEEKENGKLKISEHAWIIVVSIRKDYNQEVTVSPPKDPFRRISPTTLQNALLCSQIIDWKSVYLLMSLELAISQMFFELSARINENVTSVFPDNFYHMDIDSLEAIDLGPILETVQKTKGMKDTDLRSMHSLSGIEFLTKNWKYSNAGTKVHVGQVLKNNPSAGVVVDGEIVSGVLLNKSGLIAMLGTAPAFQRRKLGMLAMKSLMVTMGKSKFVPCSNAQKSNDSANAFHVAVGMKISHGVETIVYFGD